MPRAEAATAAAAYRPAGDAWLAALLVVWAMVVARGIYVHRYGNVLPFWDQWDAEGQKLILAWARGDLRLPDLWALHNEHRILPTRLLSLSAYVATGSWNNQLLAKLNILIYAPVPAFLAYAAVRDPTAGRWRLAMVPVLLASFVLPFDWENALTGFQSQFYVVILGSIAAMALAARRPDARGSQVFVWLLSLLCVLTLASGLLTPVAVAGVYVLTWWLRPVRGRPPVAIVLALLALAVAGYLGIPHIVGHDTIRATGARDFLHALSHLLGWPLNPYHWAAAWLWLPAPLVALRMLRRRECRPLDLLMLGCCAWSLLQAAALAYGRGHGLLEPASRYTDLLVPGLVANAWFAVRLLSDPAGRPARVAGAGVALAFFVVFAAGHADRLPRDIAAMQARGELFRIQEANVRRYLESGDPAVLQQPHLHVPYPDAALLRAWLDDPVVRDSLPRPRAPPAPAAAGQ